MTNVLIAYATTEHHAQKIAKAIADQIGGRGHHSRLFDTSKVPEDLSPAEFDKIILIGSVHERRHQESLEVFAVAYKETLKEKPTLFLSVSLSAAFEEGMPEAQTYIDMFIAETGWTPTQSVAVAGAIKHGEYDYFKEHIIEHVVLKEHDTDKLKDDHDFTDWSALLETTRQFVD